MGAHSRCGLLWRTDSLAYALAVACKEFVEVQGTRRQVDQVARDLARKDWQELNAGMGSKGPRLFVWARIELAAPEINGWQRWRLLRRSLEDGSKPAEMAYVLIFAPTGTSLGEWWKLLVHAGQWSSVLRKGKEKWAWMSTKCVPGPGMVSSRDSLNARLSPFNDSAHQRGRRRA
jgi:hypothetical protein